MIVINKVKVYKAELGKAPLYQWLDSLDSFTRNRIERCIVKLKKGYISDWKSLGRGLYEYRLFFGSGYRIYFSREYDEEILLLCGGSKFQQRTDITRARMYLEDYRMRKGL